MGVAMRQPACLAKTAQTYLSGALNIGLSVLLWAPITRER